MPKVSMILPVYNVETYIVDCIRSIVHQSCKDFELVIVDDGSEDRSIQLAELELMNADIVYKIIHRENGGLSAARNTGIKNAVGEFLCFVDSDDVISPYYIETLLFDAESNNVQLSIGNFKWVKENNKFEFDESETVGSVVDKRDFLFKILRREIFNYFGCFLITRSYVMEHELWFDESVFFGVDQAYMWRLMVNVPSYTYNYKIVYNYFNRPGSIMTSTKIDKMLTGLPSMKKCALELKDNPYFNSMCIFTRWKISALHTIAKKLPYKDFSSALSLFDFHRSDCLHYPHWKIKVLFVPSLLGSKCLYNVLRKY